MLWQDVPADRQEEVLMALEIGEMPTRDIRVSSESELIDRFQREHQELALVTEHGPARRDSSRSPMRWRRLWVVPKTRWTSRWHRDEQRAAPAAELTRKATLTQGGRHVRTRIYPHDG